MIRKTIINNQQYAISQANVLGSGGEATVVKTGPWAVKIYHPNQLTNKRVQKLHDLLKLGINWPGSVCAPRHLAFDTRGNVVGFAMMPLPQASEVVQKLSTKKYRRAHQQVNSMFIVDLFIHGHSTIRRLHDQGIIVSDFNDLNAVFTLTRMGFIDVDSFQFGSHPCMVGTENFLDPRLYNIKLETKPYFKPEHDWYSFVVMLVRSLLLTHPYGGFHPDYKTLPQRAIARVPVFDSGVKYPKPAFSFDLLNAAMKDLLHDIFKNGNRPTIDVHLLEDYRDGLVTCNSCGVQHPGECSACPQCTTVNTQQIHRQTKIITAPGKRQVEHEEWLKTPGSFIWHRLHGKTLFAIAREGNDFVLYKKHPSSVAESRSLFGAKSDLARFDMFEGKFLVVNQEPTTDEILILDISKQTPKGIARRVASVCHGERMFVCSENHLWRVQQQFLFRGNFDLSLGIYSESQVGSVMESQTWLHGSTISNAVFGYQMFFNNYEFFLHKFNTRGQRFNVKIPDLDPQESILDVSVCWAVSSLLFLMKTEIKGKTFTRVYVIHQDDGRVLSHYRVESLSSDTHGIIHGKAFLKPSNTNGFILHPTDDGVVQEVVGNNRIEKQTLFSETEQFVASSDQLIQFQKGIIIVRDNTIGYMTMQ